MTVGKDVCDVIFEASNIPNNRCQVDDKSVQEKSSSDTMTKSDHASHSGKISMVQT